MSKNQLVNASTVTLTEALNTLSQRSREVALYAFQNPDLNQTEIAEHFGISNVRVSQILRTNRVLAAFNAMARHKIKGMVPKAARTFDRVMDMVLEEPAEARKAAEIILRETKVMGAPELIVRNQYENMSYSDLQRAVQQSQSIPEPALDAEIVQDDPSSEDRP